MGRASRLKAKKKDLREQIGGDPLGLSVLDTLAAHATRRPANRAATQRPAPAQQTEAWDPLEEVFTATHTDSGKEIALPPNVRMFGNTLYSITARTLSETQMMVGYHRRDRSTLRDWRHEQQMKNEIAGPESWAVMVYPPESRLVDSSNEYWLAVFSEDVPFSFDFLGKERLVMTPEKAAEVGAVQRPWEPALMPPEFQGKR